MLFDSVFIGILVPLSMNFKFVLNQLGLLLVVLGGLMLLVAGLDVLAFTQSSGVATAMALSALVGLGIGGILAGGTRLHSIRNPETDRRWLGRREAMLLVALSWFLGALLSALPYRLWAAFTADGNPAHAFTSFADCYFEATSGLTGTGATILGNIEAIPKALLFWRALTHWFGGLGIVVLFVAVLPSLGAGGKRLFNMEGPKTTPDGVKPQIRESARTLWVIYSGLTLVLILGLRIAGMGWFDATCHAFSTIATGGLSTRNASTGAFDQNLAIDWLLIVFMVLSSVNFGLYYLVYQGKVKQVWKDTELRVYLAMLTIGSVIVTVSLLGQNLTLTTGEELSPTTAQTVRHAIFNVVSIQSTTGFCSSDFNQWPLVAQAVLITLMFSGGCSGSTSGGLKVIRVWTMLKILASEMEHTYRPQVVRPLRVGSSNLDPVTKMGVLVYFQEILLLLAVGTVLLMILESGRSDCDFATASTATLSALCTVGPGFGRVGAVENFGWFSDASKWMLSLWMVIGRLEVFAVATLFLPHFWRQD